MTSNELANMLRAQSTPPPHQILLDDQTLQRTGLNALITENLRIASGQLVLVVDPAEIPTDPPPEGFTLNATVPSGTLAFLNLADRDCTIQFIVGSQVDFVLTIQTRRAGGQPVEWMPGTSFPDLLGLPYDRLEYTDTVLTFATIDANGFEVGLTYTAGLQLTGLLAYIATIISGSGSTIYSLRGKLDRDDDGNLSFDQKADLNVPSLSLGGIVTMDHLSTGVAYSVVPVPDEDRTTSLVQLYLGAMVTFENTSGTQLPMEVRTQLPMQSDMPILMLVVLPVPGFDTTLDRLGSLIGGQTWDSFFTGPAAQLLPFFQIFGLTGYSATYSPTTLSVMSSTLSVGTLEPWTMWGDYTLTLEATWSIYFGSITTSLITVSSLFDFKILQFLVTVTLPDLTITGTQSGGPITMTLAQLNALFENSLTIPDDLLTIMVSNFSIVIGINSKQFVIGAYVSASVSLFGTQVLAIEGMNVETSIDASTSTLAYTATLSGIVRFGTIAVQANATLSNQSDTVFSLHLVDETVGSMLNHLVHMVDPTYDISLGDPWNALLDISLDALVLNVNVTKGIVSLTYNAAIDLTFIQIDSITLTYTRGTTKASAVAISIDGAFLGQRFGAGSSNPPLEWDAINQNPPAVPGAGASLFDLQYAGLGQHIAFQGIEFPNVEAVMTALQASVLPSQAGALPPFGQNSLVFSPQSNWLIGAQFSIMNTIAISAIFNDPDLYGILIALSGEKAKSFAGLKFEILYRKVTDSIGVYHIELKLPDAMRNLQFGAVSITLPVVVIDIYTNGNFRINLGFPVGLDFSNSFAMQMFPFVGFGGFYFALLDGATSTRVPQITNGTFSPVIEFGLALSLGVGKTVDAGILSGGITVTVIGIVQGVLAWFNPTDNSPKEVYYWLQGTIAIVGRLYATVDFGIIRASVDVTAYASVTLTIESHKPIYIAISAGVSVRVKVKIVFFTIHLSFSTRVDASFTIGSASPTPWILAPKSGSTKSLTASAESTSRFAQLRGQRTLRVGGHRPAGLDLATRRSLIAARLPASRLAAFGLTASEPIMTWPAVTVMPGGIQTVQIWALPAFTKAQTAGDAGMVMLLAAQNSVDPSANTASEHDELFGEDPASTTFNLLMQAMLRWGIYAETGGASTVTLDQLLDLQTQLKDPATIAAAFNYETLTDFLAANFVFDVTATTDVDTESGVAVFPMVPAIALTDTTGTAVNFMTFNMVGASYQEKVAAYFQLLQVQFGQQNPDDGGDAPTALAEADTSSMAEVIFGQYFNMLTSQGVQVAIDLLAHYPLETTAPMSIEDVAAELNDPTVLSDPMRVVSPNADLKVLNSGAELDLPEVVHQIRLNETLSSIAADFAAMGALNASGAPYTAQDILNANPNAAGIFNVGVSVNYSGITYTTLAEDTLNLITARLLLRTGSVSLISRLSGLADATLSLMLLNPSIVDENAPLVGISTIVLPNDDVFTAPTYAVVPGDTLTLVTAYFLSISQHIFDLAGATSTLAAANPGLKVTDPAATQPTGTVLNIPPLDYAFPGGATINSTAQLLITTADVVGTNLLAVPAATVMLAPQGVLAMPLKYAVVGGTGDDADTFGGIATKFDLPLETIAIQAADTQQGGAPTKIFAADVTITVDAVEVIAVDTLVNNLLDESEWNNASGMVSRFMLSGLRIPDPNSPYFESLTLEDLQDPTKLAAIPTLPLFQLTGQQYPVSAPAPQNYQVTLRNAEGVTWMNFSGANSLTFGLTADQQELLNEIAVTPLSPNIETLTRMALYQMAPKRIVLQNQIAWQAAVAPPGCLATSITTGNPTLWLFPDSLVLQVEEAAAQGTALFETVVGRDVSANQAADAEQVGCYAWGTIVDFTVTLPPTDGAAASISNAYVIGGADDTGAALLQDVYSYLTTNGAGASLYLLYSPNPTSGNPTGLSSDQLNPEATFIVKTNLSTLTHSGGDDFRLFATVDPTDVVASSLTSPADFIALLWEASITRSGGFYLSYINQNGGAAIPPSVFNNTTEATLSLLVILDSQAASRDAAILSFNNCVVIGDNIDTTTTSVFVQPAVYVVGEGDTLTTSTAAFNTLWGTSFTVLDISTFNETVPLLLLVGAMLTIPGEPTQYEIQYGDTLAKIVAKFSLPNLASLINAGANATSPILAVGAQMQFAQGVLQPSTTVPPGTIGFEITRTNPDPDGLPSDQLTPEQTVGNLFNLVGFSIAGEGVFIASGAGLPTTPADSLQSGTDGLEERDEETLDTSNWYYTQTIAVAPFGTPQNGSTSAALPAAKSNPYNGVGFDETTQEINQATIDLNMQDIYGNIQALSAPYDQLDVPVGYYDDIVSLGSWPSLAMGYTVSGAVPRVDFSMTMQQTSYIPSLSVPVASATEAAATDLASYTTIYYQLAQPDYAFSLQTTLDSNSMLSDQAAYPLAKAPFATFAGGAYVYLAAMATQTAVTRTVTGGATSVQSVTTQYSVPGAELFTANQEQAYVSLFGAAMLRVPAMYATIQNDTLASIASAHGITEADLATMNEHVPLEAGTTLLTPERTARASGTESLNTIATRMQASPGGIADANAETPGLLVEGTLFTVGTISYTIGANDTFANAAAQLGSTVAATAEANQYLDGIFTDGAALAVRDAVVADGDTFASLAAAFASGSIDTLVAGNEGVENIFVPATPVEVGVNSSPIPAGPADTLNTFATANGVTPAQLGTANDATTVFFADGAELDIPGVLNNLVREQFCTYTAGAADTLASIAAKFATTTAVITALNPDMGAVTPGSLWICPPMIGNAGGTNASLSLSGLAAAYNTDVTTLATANAATIGVLASGVALTIDGVSTTTNGFSTLNGLLSIVLSAGVNATMSDVVDAVKDVPNLIAPAAMIAPVPPPSPDGNGVAITPRFAEAVFQITANVVATRNTLWVDPDFKDVQSVRRVSFSVPPEPDQTADQSSGSYTLTEFATLMQASIPGLQVATGEPVAEGDPATSNTIWGANFGNSAGPAITFSFQGTATQYFALPPLSTSLVGGTVPIAPYISGTGLGTPQNQTFQSVDLEVWLDTFLGAVDLMLTPAYAVPGYSIASADVVSIIENKQTLAEAISQRMLYVLQVAQLGSLDDAKAAMYQSLLTQLSTAFTIDTLVQVPVTVSSPYTDVASAPRLSGKIVMADVTDALAAAASADAASTPSTFSFSTAKVSLVGPAATATFLFSVKAPSQFREANLNLQYVVTEMELPDPSSAIGEYEGSSWLKFILPLDAANSAIGDVEIPVPLRSYPSPVTLMSQTGEQSVQVPTDATDLLGWDFDFVYAHDDAEQDTPVVAVTFNGTPDPSAFSTPGDINQAAVFAALAQFITAWPTLKDDLAFLTSLAPGTTDSTALVAVQTFNELVMGVTDAWQPRALSAEFVPEQKVFYYQMQKAQTGDTESTLTTLTLTSIDPATGNPQPNPIVIWPTVFATVDGTEQQLQTVGTSTDTQAVYKYPAGIPADTALGQRFLYTWPTSAGTARLGAQPRTTNAPAATLGAMQTFMFDGVNIFSEQSGYAGVSITRNLVLVDTAATNPAFIYRTPLVSFTSNAIPTVFAGTPIALGSVPTPVGQALGEFLKTLLTSENQWAATDRLSIRFAAAYSYALAVTGTEDLNPLVPIVLVPSYDLNPNTDWDWTNSNSFVSRIQAVVNSWQARNNPVTTNGSYLFDITFFASGGQLQPLIEATSLQYQLTAS